MSRRTVWLALAGLAALPAAAQELSWSGFGTVGYAFSDRAYTYQRYISDNGTFDRDSVLGLQADLRLSPSWSATAQLKAAPSLKSDSRWDLTPAWAFVAWRPDDDWLLRAGKMRLPLYLYSESLDVGVTHDMARLPTEMYSIAPANDFNGLYATRTWPRGAGEVALDAYGGSVNTVARYWSRDGAPPQVDPGAQFADVNVRLQGLVLTLRQPDSQWRASLHHAATSLRNGSQVPVTFPFVSIGPGLGYYKVDAAQPGPPLQTVGVINNYVLTLGFEQSFGHGWRVMAEFARDLQRDTQLASDTHGGYAAVFRQVGHFTPYASVASLRSSAGTRNWYRQLTQTNLPNDIPGAAQSNAAQRLAAESTWAVDQQSIAIGSAYTIDSRQKIKFEWMRSRIGEMSRLVDTPPGSPTPSNTHIDVWSINYSFAF